MNDEKMMTRLSLDIINLQTLCHQIIKKIKKEFHYENNKTNV